ncbi:G-protein coupled receptor 22-like [Coregonus clupeaformis]|uniref:G-protein coupled receptor 22-like n=1 Tax=Coregonus clupeaformis TaxID=59861 RepID=UPI001E1C8868|nr:G-protein coupled receptor 22-like [Coregonus clupeaformis]
METDSYTPTPVPSDWAGMVVSVGALEAISGGSVSSSTAWYMPYSLGFQVSLTAFLMLELVLGFSSNMTVLVLYYSQSKLVDSVSNMVTVNLHVLDVVLCVLCLPLTLVVVLLPPGPNLALLCCFHEACVTFASIATAINVLVISVDRYDISVRPANRLLTPRRAGLLLTAVWATSLAVFFIPFLEVEFLTGGEENGKHIPASSSSAAWHNRTLLCVGGQGYHTSLAFYYHLLLQVPIFFTTVAVMLFTYSRILRALNIRIGSHIKNSQGGAVRDRTTSPPALSSAPLVSLEGPATAAPVPGPTVQASVSAIIALRRAVRRHRDRRKRQRRVFRMSLLIISTFLGCWAPLSMANVLILGLGPSDTLVSMRLWFLALAYGTTVSHPLLYAFTRQKLRRVLRAKVKKRVVSLLQLDPSPGGTVIHNSWVKPRKGCQLRLEGSDATGCCLAEPL